MRNGNNKIYHLFLAIAIVNLLVYFWLPPSSAWHLNDAIDGSNIFDKRQTIYSLLITIIVGFIWCIYMLTRRRLMSDKLILLHLFVVVLIVFVLPQRIYLPHHEVSNSPTRYYSYSTYHTLPAYTISFIIKTVALLLSELLLIKNIKKIV